MGLLRKLYNSLLAIMIKRDILKMCDKYKGYLAIFSLDKPEKNINYRHMLYDIISSCCGHDSCECRVFETKGSFEQQKEKSYLMFFDAASYLNDLRSILQKAEQKSFILFSSKKKTFFFYRIEEDDIKLQFKTHLDSLKVDSSAEDNYTLYVSENKLLNNVKFSL